MRHITLGLSKNYELPKNGDKTHIELSNIELYLEYIDFHLQAKKERLNIVKKLNSDSNRIDYLKGYRKELSFLKRKIKEPKFLEERFIKDITNNQNILNDRKMININFKNQKKENSNLGKIDAISHFLKFLEKPQKNNYKMGE